MKIWPQYDQISKIPTYGCFSGKNAPLIFVLFDEIISFMNLPNFIKLRYFLSFSMLLGKFISMPLGKYRQRDCVCT